VWTLGRAFRSGDRTVRSKAMREFQHYRELHGQPRLWQPYWEERAPHMAKTLFQLSPPLIPIKCKDFWHVNNWQSRLDRLVLIGRGILDQATGLDDFLDTVNAQTVVLQSSHLVDGAARDCLKDFLTDADVESDVPLPGWARGIELIRCASPRILAMRIRCWSRRTAFSTWSQLIESTSNCTTTRPGFDPSHEVTAFWPTRR
jgi:hypothetical protein